MLCRGGHSYGRGKPVEIWEMMNGDHKNHHARNSSAFISRENEHESKGKPCAFAGANSILQEINY
jgi:hypothetical protein